MSIIDSYGDFDLPEEKSVIEVVEDPVKTILSVYDLYDKTAQSIIENATQLKSSGLLYELAEKLFADKNLKISAEQIKEIIQILIDKPEEETWLWETKRGIFLSALHNLSSIETLVIEEFPHYSGLGHNLKSNKKLVIGPKITSDCIGDDSEGVILNYGVAQFLGAYGKGGIIINKGRSKIRWPWDEGIQIINYEPTHYHHDEDKPDLKGLGYLPVPHKSNTRLRFYYTNEQFFFDELKTSKDEVIMQNKLSYDSKPIIEKINQQLNTPKFLAIIKDDDFNNWQSLLKKVTEFNWQKLEQELLIICEEKINHRLATLYKR